MKCHIPLSDIHTFLTAHLATFIVSPFFPRARDFLVLGERVKRPDFRAHDVVQQVICSAPTPLHVILSALGFFAIKALKCVISIKGEKTHITTSLWTDLFDVKRYADIYVFIGQNEVFHWEMKNQTIFQKIRACEMYP